MKLYPLTNDIIFKSVFGRSTTTPILIPLLNAVLGDRDKNHEKIRDATVTNPFFYGEGEDGKEVILDINVADNRNHRYNVEMQVRRDKAYIQRAIYYMSSLYTSQIKKSVKFNRLNRTVGISFVSFTLFKWLKKLHSICRLYEIEEQKEITRIVELHFLELSKFKGTSPERLTTPLERWLHLLKYSLKYATRKIGIPPELKAEEGIEMAIEQYRSTLGDERVQEMMRMREKAELITNTRIDQEVTSGIARGMRKARQKLREEKANTERRLQEERADALRKHLEDKREMARRLRERGMDTAEIRDITRLSEEEMEGV